MTQADRKKRIRAANSTHFRVPSLGNSLAERHPELLLEWDYSKNSRIPTPDKLSFGVELNVWWKCEQGHSWQSRIDSRRQGRGKCYFCNPAHSGGKIRAGVNDLETVSPHLALFWDAKFNGFEAKKLPAKSNKQYWWICNEGHRWEDTPNNLLRNMDRDFNFTICKVCRGKNFAAGVNDLGTKYPHLVKEFDSVKNGTTIDQVPNKNGIKKYFWLCDKSHSYEATLNSRRQNKRSCPICSGYKVLEGFNDIASQGKKAVVDSFDYNKNEFSSKEIYYKSGKALWWKCELGHSWQSTPANRDKGSQCLVCINKTLLQGFNDLETKNPEIALEWDYKLNADLLPNQILYGSHLKYNWICKNGHQWEATASHRTMLKTNCPVCKSGNSSRIETAIRDRIAEINSCIIFPKKQNRIPAKWGIKNQINVDISGETFLGQKFVIEYDGWFYHKNEVEQDITKTLILLELGYIVLRVREGKLKKLELNNKNLIQISFEHSLDIQEIDNIVNKILEKLLSK